MTSNRKIAANQRNGRKSRGPRSAVGKAIASRNALRHGLACVASDHLARPGEIDRLAKAICGNDNDPFVFAEAVKIAQSRLVLRAVRAHQVVAVERLRELDAVPFAKRDRRKQLATARFMQAWLAHREITMREAQLLKKYNQRRLPPLKLEVPMPLLVEDHIVPINLKALLQELSLTDQEREELLEEARRQIAHRDENEQRDEYEATEAAILDLIRLDRYERRAWSRQKKAVRQFITLKGNAGVQGG